MMSVPKSFNYRGLAGKRFPKHPVASYLDPQPEDEEKEGGFEKLMREMFASMNSSTQGRFDTMLGQVEADRALFKESLAGFTAGAGGYDVEAPSSGGDGYTLSKSGGVTTIGE